MKLPQNINRFLNSEMFPRYQTICSWNQGVFTFWQPRTQAQFLPQCQSRFQWHVDPSILLHTCLTVSGWPQQLSPFHTATLPASLSPGAASSISCPQLVTLASLFTPPFIGSLLCLKPAISSSATQSLVFDDALITATRGLCLGAGSQQVCSWGHPFLWSWEHRVQVPGTGPLCLQLQHLPLCWQYKRKQSL